jgi:acyl carrier protein phosphodiesterase
LNFLAHAVLSFNRPEILVGNMISDFVKGKKQFEFEEMIRLGIKLHRSIDSFTDEHTITKSMKRFYRDEYGLYSAVLVDVSYDYFLANDEKIFPSEDALKSFTKNTYQKIENHQQILPENFALAFSYMQKQDWLYHYSKEDGIAKSFAGLQRRSRYMKSTDEAMQIFKQNKNEMKSLYEDFFPQVNAYALTKLEELINSAFISLK